MNSILREVGMIARALDSISNIEFKELDLTKGQFLYVVRICENEGIIPDKLADLIKVDRTTAARAIRKLEMNGFIEKRNDTVNKKIKRLYPTEKGRDIYPYIIREHTHSEQVALARLSDDEITQLLQLLQHMRKNIEVDWDFVKKGNKRLY